MTRRLDPFVVSPKEMQELISFQEFREVPGLDESLLELLRARVSQLNGCACGIGRHLRRAHTLGESRERLCGLYAWRTVPHYSERERAAFAWAEAVTLASHEHVTDRVFLSLRPWFSDTEIVRLTMMIVATNAWNRVALSFSCEPASLPDIGLD